MKIIKCYFVFAFVFVCVFFGNHPIDFFVYEKGNCSVNIKYAF